MRAMEKDRLDAWEGLLARMEGRGVHFYLNGCKSRPDEIIRRCCVCEESDYMADFVTDEEGRLTEIRYDEVTAYE